MDGYDAYKYYMAVKMHFTSDSYDAFKYNFKTRVTQKSYWGRHDKYQLTKVGNRFNNREDITKYFACHFINDITWIGDMMKSDETYNSCLRVQESLTYNFKQELEEISDRSLDESLTGTPYPRVITDYMEGLVSLETVCVLNSLTGFMNQDVSDTILWPDIKSKVLKYQPFISFDEDKMKKVVLDTLY